MALKDITIGELAEEYDLSVVELLRRIDQACKPAKRTAEALTFSALAAPPPLSPGEVEALVSSYMAAHPDEGVATGDIKKWIQGQGRRVSSQQIRRALGSIPGVTYSGEKRFTRYFLEKKRRG